MLAVALPLAFIVGTDAWKRLALVGVILLLIAVELINTAIEKLSDQVTTTRASRDRAHQRHGLGGRRRRNRHRRPHLAGCAR